MTPKRFTKEQREILLKNPNTAYVQIPVDRCAYSEISGALIPI